MILSQVAHLMIHQAPPVAHLHHLALAARVKKSQTTMLMIIMQ